MADVEVVEEVEAEITDPVVNDAASSTTEPEVTVEAQVPPITQPEPAPVKVSKPRTPRARPESGLTHVVLRRFFGAGEERYPGEVVDASAWHAERLVDARRLRTLTPDDPKPTEADGRFFINDDALIAYAESVIEAATQAPESEED